MYVSIRRYHSQWLDELVRRVNTGFVPIISAVSGFVSYQIVDGGNGVFASISVFETREGAEESNRLAASWVRENIATLVSGPAEITAGLAVVEVMASREHGR